MDRKSVSGPLILVSTHTELVTEFAEIDLNNNAIERVSFNTVVEALPKVRVEGDVTVRPILE